MQQVIFISRVHNLADTISSKLITIRIEHRTNHFEDVGNVYCGSSYNIMYIYSIMKR